MPDHASSQHDAALRMSWQRFLSANRFSIAYGALVGVMPLLVSAGATALAIRYEQWLHSFDAAAWTIFYAVASVTMAFGLTPTTFIALLSGYFAGWSTLPGVLASYLVASLMGYGAARVVDGGRFVRSVEIATGKATIISRLREGEIPFIILVRISPFLPFAIMNVLLAALRVDLKTFVVAGFVGMLPRTLLFVWVGMQFGALVTLLTEGSQSGVARGMAAALVAVSAVGLYLFFRRYLADVLPDRQAEGESP